MILESRYQILAKNDTQPEPLPEINQPFEILVRNTFDEDPIIEVAKIMPRFVDKLGEVNCRVTGTATINEEVTSCVARIDIARLYPTHTPIGDLLLRKTS